MSPNSAHIQILKPLGAGCMGEGYKARDTRLNRAVANKVPSAHFRPRFAREARAIAALNPMRFERRLAPC